MTIERDGKRPAPDQPALLWVLVRHLPALVGHGLHTQTIHKQTGNKSIFIRHLDGGSSNAVEMELTALLNPIYDLAQYGIQFVSSPRHADVLLLTGPLTCNMLGPAKAAFEAMPNPKSIVTVGDCADFLAPDYGSKCPFADSYPIVDLPMDMKRAIKAHVPGNPPTPNAIIDTLLTLQTP